MKFAEEHLILKETVRKRMEADDIKEMIKKYERHDAPFPWEFVHEMAKLGLCGINIPEEYGGAGMDNLSGVIAMIEMCKVCPGLALILGVGNSLVGDPLYRLGNDAQKKKWLSGLAAGKFLGAFCLTEPNHGSDAATLETYAERVEGGFLISGEKCFSTNAPVAKFLIVFARTDRAVKDHRGVSAFLIPVRRKDKKSGALEIRKPDQKLGLHAAHMGSIKFNNLFVPASCLLGEPERGFGKGAMATLDHGRNWIAAQGIGILDAALRLALKHAQIRIAFGGPIIVHSGIGDPIVRMALAADISRILLFYSAWLEDQKAEFAHYASLVKLFSSEEARELTQEAQRIYGGSGYLAEMEVARFVVDSLPLDIYEGASNVQRDRILKAWLGDKLQVYPPPPLTYLLANLKDGVRQRLGENDLLKVKNQRYAARVADILPLVAAWDIFQKEFKKEWPKEFMIFQDSKVFEERLLEELRLRWPYEELMPKDAIFDKTHEHLLGCGQKGI